MEDVLQQIARTPKLACSSLVLEFLGAKRGHKDVNRLEITQTKKVMNSKQIIRPYNCKSVGTQATHYL